MKINEFGRLNARKTELEREVEALKKRVESYDDAETEAGLVIAEEDEEPFLFLVAESFVTCTEDEVTERLAELTAEAKEELAAASVEMEGLEKRLGSLKTDLYGRFGKSINLEA